MGSGMGSHSKFSSSHSRSGGTRPCDGHGISVEQAKQEVTNTKQLQQYEPITIVGVQHTVFVLCLCEMQGLIDCCSIAWRLYRRNQCGERISQLRQEGTTI